MSSRAAPERWCPLYSGATAEVVCRAILPVGRESVGEAAMPEPRLHDPSLMGGDAGLALYHFHLFASTADRRQRDLARRYLDRATSCLTRLPLAASLYRGFTGIVWVLAHLSGRLTGDDEYSTDDIDETLLRYVERGGGSGFDLASGLIGIGVYFLERLPVRRALEGVEMVTAELRRRAVRRGDRSHWVTPPMLLPPDKQLAYPLGMADLGMAHGLSGAIAFLSRVVVADVATSVAGPLLGEAVNELLGARMEGEASQFPYWIETRGDPPSRLAWCYGDLGAALSVYAAGRSTKRVEWCEVALEIARRAASRHPAGCGVADAGLCHGAAGIAHVFHRLYRSSGDEVLRQAAQRWFAETLERLRTDRPAATESPLLTGHVGARLALLASVSETAPDWDSILLTSIPS